MFCSVLERSWWQWWVSLQKPGMLVNRLKISVLPDNHKCDHSPRARHPGMQSPVGLRKTSTNKASGSDGIPVELFQILKDDAVKVLYSICQQVWKTQQWPQDWKRSGFIPIPMKGNAKECSNYCTIAFI